jgi:hypothetical protein
VLTKVKNKAERVITSNHNGLVQYARWEYAARLKVAAKEAGVIVDDDSLDERDGTAARAPAQGPNFTPAAQNGFATRMKWSAAPKRADANHEPRVMIRGNSRISARPGETIRLQAVASDPDGNAVVVKWWQWKDVGTYPGQVMLSNPTSLATSMQAPADATAGQTIHLILEATDNGTPALTRYQRIVVTVTR